MPFFAFFTFMASSVSVSYGLSNAASKLCVVRVRQFNDDAFIQTSKNIRPDMVVLHEGV